MPKLQCILLMLFFVTQSFAEILIVDNNPNNPALQPGSVNAYYELQKAVNEARPGDTIQVVGSATPYDFAKSDKSLVLIGSGYHNPYGESTRIAAKDGVSLYISAKNDLEGITIKGIEFMGELIFEAAAGNHKLADVHVDRCFFSGARGIRFTNTCCESNGFTNVIVSNCLFGAKSADFSEYFDLRIDTDASLIRSMVIANNIFQKSIIKGALKNQEDHVNFYSQLLFASNAFLAKFEGFTSTTAGQLIQGLDFNDNIFYGTADMSQAVTLSSYSYNIFFNSPIPSTGNFLKSNFNQDPVFVNYSGGAFSWTDNLRMSDPIPGIYGETSPIGLYGGIFPFSNEADVGANPDIPQITELIIEKPIIRQGEELKIRFKAIAQP